jgi:hypothetical protein
MSLTRQRINPCGGTEYRWDGSWETGIPSALFRLGDSVVDHIGARRFCNACCKCGYDVWLDQFVPLPATVFCPNCQPSAETA